MRWRIFCLIRRVVRDKTKHFFACNTAPKAAKQRQQQNEPQKSDGHREKRYGNKDRNFCHKDRKNAPYPRVDGQTQKKRPKASSFFYPTSKITITPDCQKDKSATPSGTPLGTDGGGRLDDSLAGVGYGKVDDNHGAHGVVGDEQHPTASFADALEAARFNLDFGRLARFERRLVQAHSQTGVIDL